MRLRIRALAALLPLAMAGIVVSCGLDKLTASATDEIPPSLEGFAVQGDSVVVIGDQLTLTAQLPTELQSAPGVRVIWTSDDATIASVDASGRVSGVNPGTTRINAVVESPSLSEPFVRPHAVRVRYNTIGILPFDSLTGLGATVRLYAFGTRRDGSRHSFIDPVYSFATTTESEILGLTTGTSTAFSNSCTPPSGGFCRVIARRTGTVTLRATHQGLTGTLAVRVVQVPTRISFATPEIVIPGVGEEGRNPVTIYDTQDSVIASPTIVWTSLNTSIATVNSSGMVRGVGIGTTQIRATAGQQVSLYTVRVVIPGPPAGVKIRPITTNITAGIAPAFAVDIVDAEGIRVPSATNSVTLSQVAGPTNSLVGTLTVSAANGTAHFPAARLRFAGNNTVAASSAGLTSDQRIFTVVAAPSSRLVFTTQPSSVQVSTTLSPVRVAFADSIGNTVTTAAGNITIAVGTNPGNSTLTGTLTQAATNGVATFNNLSLNVQGSGYTLVASSTGFGNVTSSAFAVVGAPNRVAFATQPATNSPAGAALPAFTVQIQDASGNLVGNATTAVTITVDNSCSVNHGLSGTLTVNAVDGVATFSAVRLRQSCAVYRLRATGTGLSVSAASNSFTVVPSVPARLSVNTQPTTRSAGCCSFIIFNVLDSLGNVNTATNVEVTVALGNNPGGATMTGTLTRTSSNGSATFSDLTITKAGTGYTLVGSATGLTSATSDAFDIQPNNASKVVFLVSPPASVRTGQVISPAVVVEVRDFFDNPVPGYSGNVSLTARRQDFAFTSSSLGGTTTVAVSSGRATFSNLVMTGTESNPMVLVATAVGLGNGISSTFTVVP